MRMTPYFTLFFLVFSFALFGWAIFDALTTVQDRLQTVDIKPRPEFGTHPPDCAHLSDVEWQECMGVGPR